MSGRAVVTARTFAQLERSEQLNHLEDTELGPVYGTRDARTARRIRVLAPADLKSYATLHQYGRMWVHRDYDHNAWLSIAVDDPVEIAADFIAMPRRFGDTLQLYARNPRLTPPARLGTLRTLMPKLLAAAEDAVDVWMTRLVTTRVTTPDPNTFYDAEQDRFCIQDFSPTRAELALWDELRLSGAD